MYNQVALLGTPIHIVTMEQTLRTIESFIRSGKSHQIATANTDFLVKALRDPELRTVLGQCDLVVPDGMPLLWVSQLMGFRMPERVTGADLVPRLGELSAAKGWRLFLLGGTPEASLRAERSLRRLYPRVEIAGRLAPAAAPLEQMDDRAVLDEIDRARPDILLVAFGNPKQEKWIYRNREKLKVPVSIGVGAALDFLGGSVPRAPRWMRSSGLEWMHRILCDPRRLGRRYLVDAIQFARYLPPQLMAHAWSARGASDGILRHELPGTTVLQVQGRFTRTQLPRFERECRSALTSGRNVIVDLSAACTIGADALGALMSLERCAARENARLSLAGLSPALQRTMRLSRAGSFFHTVPGVVEALADASAEKAQVNLELAEGSVTCHLAGELSGSRAKAALEVCDRLLGCFAEVRIDTRGLSESSRALFARLRSEANSARAADSAA